MLVFIHFTKCYHPVFENKVRKIDLKGMKEVANLKCYIMRKFFNSHTGHLVLLGQ